MIDPFAPIKVRACLSQYATACHRCDTTRRLCRFLLAAHEGTKQPDTLQTQREHALGHIHTICSISYVFSCALACSAAACPAASEVAQAPSSILHGTPLQVIDEDGVNRTPKPLVAIVTSAALRQARYLGMQESALGSESSEALLGEMSSSGFGRSWFDSGTITPQESATELDFSCE